MTMAPSKDCSTRWDGLSRSDWTASRWDIGTAHGGHAAATTAGDTRPKEAGVPESATSIRRARIIPRWEKLSTIYTCTNTDTIMN